MSITRLSISDFRNLQNINLQPISNGFNIFYGLNGSGKTSLLEAVYYLSVGRSFRSHRNNRVIRYEAKKFSIFANIFANDQQIPIGIERHEEGDLRIRISGKDAKSNAELAAVTPVQLINSSCFNLLEGGPSFRRKYLDWGAFYLGNEFLTCWQAYNRILKQRNAALRQRNTSALDAWTKECAESAVKLHHFRTQYVETLLPMLDEVAADLFNISNLSIHYYPGWDTNRDLKDILYASFDKDLHMGSTQFGPHRADLKIAVNKLPAREILSRGQQKLFICAMIAAQGMLLKKHANIRSIYLVDDLPAELDLKSRTHLMSLLAKQESQVFITTVERNIIDELDNKNSLKVFHVEHGGVTESTSTDSR